MDQWKASLFPPLEVTIYKLIFPISMVAQYFCSPRWDSELNIFVFLLLIIRSGQKQAVVMYLKIMFIMIVIVVDSTLAIQSNQTNIRDEWLVNCSLFKSRSNKKLFWEASVSLTPCLLRQQIHLSHSNSLWGNLFYLRGYYRWMIFLLLSSNSNNT